MLSDILKPQLVELGSVKIGTLGEERPKRGGGTFRLPVKLTSFWITTRVRGDDGILKPDEPLMEALKEQYADPDGQLRRIPIALLSDNIEEVLRSAWVHYRGKACFARSDGKTLIKFRDMKTGDVLPEPEEMPWKDEYAEQKFNGAPLFKKHTALTFVIASQEATYGGVYRFRTTSVISADQLYGSLLHLKQLTGGVLTGMPLILRVRPIIVMPEGKPTTVHVVHVELHGPDLMALQQRALEVTRFRKAHRLEMQQIQREMRLIAHDPGWDEDEATQAEMQQEFHPEAPDPRAEFMDKFAKRLAEADTVDAVRDLALMLDGMDPPLSEDQKSECELYVARRLEALAATD